MHGDTTVVRTAADGAWGPARDAVEEKRAGVGTTAATFGEVNAAIVLPSGGALVFDLKSVNGPALEMFDADGRFVATVGRPGSGPGEYRTQPGMSLAAGADGTLFVLDAANNRIDRFAANG